MRKSLIISASLLINMSVMADVSNYVASKPKEAPFYVYQDSGFRGNHYIPSGWMGDYGDLKMNQRWDKNPSKGKYSIQVTYTAEKKQGSGWSGIYWQMPANNWGDKFGGYDLTGFKKLKFMARGDKGNEYVDKFLVGGITGQGFPGDSDTNDTGAVELTKEWKEYVIPLENMDLSTIIGGFGLVFNSEMNPNGAVVYLDEIRFEK